LGLETDFRVMTRRGMARAAAALLSVPSLLLVGFCGENAANAFLVAPSPVRKASPPALETAHGVSGGGSAAITTATTRRFIAKTTATLCPEVSLQPLPGSEIAVVACG
jgi:hypothetical protein